MKKLVTKLKLPIKKIEKPRERRKEKAVPIPIVDVAKSVGIRRNQLESCGSYRGKISLDILRSGKQKKNCKYIVVSSITPTPFGEGKTLTTIGLSMAFKKLKRKSISCIMQPSVAGLFGMKGPGIGAGLSELLPNNDMNFFMSRDNYAIETAHNLCAAFLDNNIFRGNHLDLNLDEITWKRVIDINDRALRNINIGLGGKLDGVLRKTGFDLVSSSELMAILCIANSVKDMRKRIGEIIVGFTKKGRPVFCEEIKASGIMAAILKNALMPNLLQTTEHTPCLVHTTTGPTGAVSLGMSSVVADKIALALSDYVITETAFGADMGAERFFDIKCRIGDLKPDACVLVVSARALKMHSGDFEVTQSKIPRELNHENISAIESGLSNLEKQIENIKTFGVPCIVTVNRFTENTDKEIQAITKRARDLGANACSVSNMWQEGSLGGIELAKTIIEVCKSKSNFRFLYPLDMPIKDKIRRIARTIYGAQDVVFSEAANQKTFLFKKLNLENMPVCIAKTPLSLSHNPKKKGRPHGFKFVVDDLYAAKGAGYIVAYSQDTKKIPGLPKLPRVSRVDLNENGDIVNLF